MRRLFFILGIASSLFLFAPQHVRAANLPPTILPSCDETRYEVQKKSCQIPEECYASIAPEKFDVAPYLKANWEVTGYSTTQNCGFNDFLQIFVNLFSWGLYVLSVLALFFFFLGGGTLLLSGGNEERVRTGKTILVNTVIGLGIALGSWLIVNLTMNALLPEGQKKSTGEALLNGQPWFSYKVSYPKCAESPQPPQYPCTDSGSTVRDIQQQLIANLCYDNNVPSAADGSFGPKTLEAWHRWQRANSKTETDVLTGADELTLPCI